MALVETTKDQAHSNYLRNRGTPGQWYQHTADYRDPQPQPRLRQEAKEIAEKNKPSVSEVFHNYRLESDAPPAPVRLRDDDARRIADKFNYQEDKWFDFQGNYAFRPQPRGPKLYPPSNVEVAQRAGQSRGGDWFDHSRPAEPHSPPAVRCSSVAGREVAAQMRAESDWFRHDASSASSRPSTAPRGSSRTRAEGAEFAERNRLGSAADWMPSSEAGDSSAGIVVYGGRCPTASSQANCQAARGHQMRECFDYEHPHPEPASGFKVKGELAREVCERNRRGLLETMGAKATEARVVRKTRPEAEEFAQRAKGQVGSVFDQTANVGYRDPPPAPRVKPGLAQEVADKNRGMMSSCLADNDYRPPPKDHKIHQRTNKTEQAKEVAERSKGDAVKQLVGSSSLPPEPPRKSKTSWGEGAETAAQRNRGTAGLVITGAAPPSARAPGPRVRRITRSTSERTRRSRPKRSPNVAKATP